MSLGLEFGRLQMWGKALPNVNGSGEGSGLGGENGCSDV